jgi:hypothetical protein
MSWFSENYEKAALGAGALVAAGLVFVGWQKYGSVENDFSSEPKGTGPSDPSVKNGDLVSTAKASYSLERQWIKGDDNGRPVDLFTGVALFVNKNDPTKPLDLIKGEDVHEGIPNQWWLDNRIDPGFGDSPQRDPDEDGFSNIEEYAAKTDPNDGRDFPSLLSKLSYAGDESVMWVLRPGFESEGAFTFEYSDNRRNANKVGAANPVPPGQLFFENGAAKGRFKFTGSKQIKQVNKKIGAEIDVTIVEVEDQKPNKLGVKYDIPAGFRKSDARNFSHFDRTAILTLDALDIKGKEFKIEENTSFSLPPGGEKKDYKLLEVTPDKIKVEVTDKDGNKKTHEFAKGNLGPIAE